jgi:hypothetical protein
MVGAEAAYFEQFGHGLVGMEFGWTGFARKIDSGRRAYYPNG